MILPLSELRERRATFVNLIPQRPSILSPWGHRERNDENRKFTARSQIASDQRSYSMIKTENFLLPLYKCEAPSQKCDQDFGRFTQTIGIHGGNFQAREFSIGDLKIFSHRLIYSIDMLKFHFLKIILELEVENSFFVLRLLY